jgi:CRP-like cAMP-binding protein
MSGRAHELSEIALFSETNRAERAIVRRHLTELQVPAGHVLMHAGVPQNEFMVIAEGQATMHDGNVAVAKLSRGDLVGEMAMIDRIGRRNAGVTTDTEVVVLAGTRADFREILEVAPSVAVKVMKSAAGSTKDAPPCRHFAVRGLL